jgi:hypothetical protein
MPLDSFLSVHIVRRVIRPQDFASVGLYHVSTQHAEVSKLTKAMLLAVNAKVPIV